MLRLLPAVVLALLSSLATATPAPALSAQNRIKAPTASEQDCTRAQADATARTHLGISAASTTVAVEPPLASRAGVQASKVLLNSTKQLAKKFKHAADFGVKGTYNKAKAAAFSRALNQHCNQAGVQAIKSAYRGVGDVIHHVDPKTGLNVMTDLGGKFVSGWKLNPAQLQNVLTRGSL